jgi:leucyl/phenylalanyl-tRNA--protein transferase
MPLDGLHISRSLRRTLTSGRFTTSADTDFGGVVAGCADRPGEGTWITPSLAVAYGRLHELGLAHAVEVRDRTGTLAGGIYGIALGGAFFGESMFSRATDASKVALVDLCDRLRAGGFRLFDVQVMNPHLATLGAVPVPRATFLRALDEALAVQGRFRNQDR